MDLIKKELKSWSDTLRIDNVPKAPTGTIFFMGNSLFLKILS